jgi:hypothetical protein
MRVCVFGEGRFSRLSGASKNKQSLCPWIWKELPQKSIFQHFFAHHRKFYSQISYMSKLNLLPNSRDTPGEKLFFDQRIAGIKDFFIEVDVFSSEELSIPTVLIQ